MLLHLRQRPKTTREWYISHTHRPSNQIALRSNAASFPAIPFVSSIFAKEAVERGETIVEKIESGAQLRTLGGSCQT